MAIVQSCSVIIISYNSGSLLPTCLHSIYRAFEGIEGQVIVLDNGSPEALPNTLKEDYPQVEWMESDRNLGFGAACNRAANKARHPYLFFVNPDTLVSKDTFVELLGSIESKPEAGVVGCKILNGDGTLQWACRRSFPSPMAAIYKTLGLARLFPKSRTFGAYNLTYLDPEEENEVDAVSGSFFCVRKTVYEQVNGFDEDFFLYGEDLDICYRIQQAGYHNYYVPNSAIIHFKGQSSKTRMVRSYIDFYQAMLIFARKHPKFLQPVPLWMNAAGVFCAALLGVFSRLLPDWRRMFVDLAWLGALWSLTSTVIELDHYGLGLLILMIATIGPLALLGEYGPLSLSSRNILRFAAPANILICGLGVFMFGLSRYVPLLGLVILIGTWLWRRLLHWFRYFHGVFSGRRRRSALLGCPVGVDQWFLRENLLPGRDILGCVSSVGCGDERVHYLGPTQEFRQIRARTGIREILVVPDRKGNHEEIPADLVRLGLKIESRLLIGHPDTSTFAMVDLNFLK